MHRPAQSNIRVLLRRNGLYRSSSNRLQYVFKALLAGLNCSGAAWPGDVWSRRRWQMARKLTSIPVNSVRTPASGQA